MNINYVYVKCTACGSKNRIPVERLHDGPVCGKCKSPINGSAGTPDYPLEVTDASFPDEVLHYPGAAMVEFFAPWCGACKSLSPTIDELARENAGSVKVAKVNVDRNPMLSARFQINSTPTMVLFKKGKEVKRMVGALPKNNIQRELRNVA